MVNLNKPYPLGEVDQSVGQLETTLSWETNTKSNKHIDYLEKTCTDLLLKHLSISCLGIKKKNKHSTEILAINPF